MICSLIFIIKGFIELVASEILTHGIPLCVSSIKLSIGLGDAPRFAFVESAVASDRPGFNFPFDRSICITASYYLRLGRNPKVAVRDSLQHFNLEKFDAVVYNDKSMEDLYASLNEIIDTVL